MIQPHQLDPYWKTLGTTLVMDLSVYLRTLRTYQSNNALVTNAQKQILDTLQKHFSEHAEPIHLQFLDCETFINNSLLGMGFQEFCRASELARLLRGFNVGEITFNPGISSKSLTELADAFSDAIHKRTDGLPAELDQISMRPLSAGAANGVALETHKVCVWLFSGLLNALDGLQKVHDGGLAPMMTPFKRHLRMTAEVISERNAVFQLLTANRSHKVMDGDAFHCCVRTFDVMGFGAALGLSRPALMTLGLSSVLDQLTANQGVEDMFQTVSRIHSLGDMAPGVIMTLWDLELIRENGKGGKLAQILDVADHYVRLTQEQRTPQPNAELWTKLHRLAPRSRSIINQFQQWKGTWPSGSIVQHPELGQSLVIDQTGTEDTVRVSPFDQWGIMAEPVECPVALISASYLGPIHALRLPSDENTAERDSSKPPPFPLPEAHGRQTLSIGDVFGGKDGKRFEAIGIAGEGAQATVFRTRDTRLDRIVATKVSNVPSPAMRAKMMERFERELRLSTRVNHSHVVQLFDCGELEGGTPYMLIEWMEKGDLAAFLESAWSAGQHLPIKYVHYYALSIASALKAVHNAKIVHRDIKLNNVLIRADGVAKLTDFGIAKDLSSEGNSLTELGQTLGTLGFMAPEQLAGLPGPQSDIFSFGVMLYQLLTSEVPVQEMKNAIPNGVILDSAWALVPPQWAELIRQLTAPDLDDRAQDFDAVIRMLLNVDLGQADSRDLLQKSHLPPLPQTQILANKEGLHTQDFLLSD